MFGIFRHTYLQIRLPLKLIHKLHTSLIRSQLTYCSIIWRPYLIQDITKLEKNQRRATKYILNDYSSNYKNIFIIPKIAPFNVYFQNHRQYVPCQKLETSLHKF